MNGLFLRYTQGKIHVKVCSISRWRGGNDNEYWKAKDETTNNAHIGHYCGRWTEGLGTRKFALTRSSSSSRVAPSLGKRPLWNHGQNHARHGRKTRNIQREATCATRRPSSLPDLIKSVCIHDFCQHHSSYFLLDLVPQETRRFPRSPKLQRPRSCRQNLLLLVSWESTWFSSCYSFAVGMIVIPRNKFWKAVSYTSRKLGCY